MTTTKKTGECLADDLLRGVKPIAAFLGETESRAYYMLERGHVPAGKVGAYWTASKSALRAHFAKITSGGA